MKMSAWMGVAVAALGFAAASATAAVPYWMQFQTHYEGPVPSDAVAGIGGSPDTGFARFFNNGGSTFNGTFGLFGVAPGQTINLSFNGSLAPGQTLSLLAGPESSNQGGFNADPLGGANLGLLVTFVGTVTDAFGTENVNFQAYDRDIHSGAPRVNPFGVTVDSYVLQGGDPFGRDTGDGFEESQAPGIQDFQQVPAPGALALMGVAGLAAARRRR